MTASIQVYPVRRGFGKNDGGLLHNRTRGIFASILERKHLFKFSKVKQSHLGAKIQTPTRAFELPVVLSVGILDPY